MIQFSHFTSVYSLQMKLAYFLQQFIKVLVLTELNVFTQTGSFEGRVLIQCLPHCTIYKSKTFISALKKKGRPRHVSTLARGRQTEHVMEKVVHSGE